MKLDLGALPPVLAQRVEPEAIRSLCERWEIVALSLFGSAVRPDFGPASDVDVLVRFSETAGWSLFDLIRLRDELHGLFGREIDLVEERALRNPFRRREILGSRRVLYAAA